MSNMKNVFLLLEVMVGWLTFSMCTQVDNSIIQWKKYYDCLTRYKSTVIQNKVVTPIFLMGFKGQSVIMQCPICSMSNRYHMEWTHKQNGIDIALDKTKPHNAAMIKGTLKFYQLEMEHSGFYTCSYGFSKGIIHLEVLNVEENMPIIRYEKASVFDLNQYTDHINTSIMYEKWNAWTECSSCDSKGIKKIVGIGYLRNITLNDRYIVNIPGRSSYMPKNISSLIINGSRNYIVVAACEEKCRNFRKYFNKNDVRSLKNLFEIVKSEPPVSQMIYIDMYINQTILLDCPGNIRRDIPIGWAIEGDNITYYYGSDAGKYQITILDQLKIYNVTKKDAKLYRCLIRGKVIGIINMHIIDSPHKKLNSWIDIIKLLLLSITLVLLYTKLFLMNSEISKII